MKAIEFKRPKLKNFTKKLKNREDTTIKEEAFFVFLRLGTVGAGLSLLRAIIANQGLSAILVNIMVVLICVASLHACKDAKKSRLLS